MIRFAEKGSSVGVHSYLVAFCALAAELYPQDDWATVEPKLQRSWERYIADGACGWEDVRQSAHARWLAATGSPA